MAGLRSIVVAAALSAAASAWAQGNCVDCGVVTSIRYVEEKGKGSGLGLVAGGVVGGVLGHQIGSGRGNTVATIAGAAGGAYAGNEIEKNQKKQSYWAVAIRMDNGATRNFTYTSKPAVNEGERVRLVEGGRRLALVAN
jgi:outer membrane lipoprotein SlyB